MPSPTYVALAKTVLTADQTTITFNSIPSTYTDLLLVASIRTTAPAVTGNAFLRVNNDATSIYSQTYFRGDGSTAASGRFTTTSFQDASAAVGDTATANTFSNHEYYIPNYAGSTNKVISMTAVGETNAATGVYIVANAGLYSSTTAVSRLDLIFNTRDAKSGSRFDLYGIKNV